MIIRELLVRLGVITDTKQVKEYDGAIEDLKGQLQDVVGVAKRVALAAAAVGTALAAQAISTARAAEAADRQAKALAIGVEAAQEYTAVFEGVGADANDVADVFNTLADRAQDAGDGMQSFIDDFGLVGLAVQDLKDKEPEQLFLTFADAVASTDDVVKRNAAVVRLLGDDVGNRLIPALMQGSAGIAAMRQEARDLGLVMSAEDITAAKNAAVAFRSFDRVLTGLRNQIGLAVIPTMVRLAGQLRDFITRTRAIAREKLERVMEVFGDAVDTTRGKLASLNTFVEDNLAGWGNVFRRAQTALVVLAGAKAWGILTAAFAAIKAGVLAVGAAFSVGFAPASLIVLGLAAVVATLAFAIDDVLTYMRGGESVIGSFMGYLEEVAPVTANLAYIFESVGMALAALADSPAWVKIQAGIEVLSTIGEGWLTLWGRQLESVLKLVSQMVEMFATGAALLRGEASFGDLFREAVETAGAGTLALPGVGAISGGLPTSFLGNNPATKVPTFAPSRPAPRGGGGGSTTQVTVQGSTTYINAEMTQRQVEERDRRKDKELSRQIAAYTGLEPS